jgi:hypothetical protein
MEKEEAPIPSVAVLFCKYTAEDYTKRTLLSSKRLHTILYYIMHAYSHCHYCYRFILAACGLWSSYKVKEGVTFIVPRV